MTIERITFNVANVDGVVTMSLCGELDVYTLPKIKKAVDIVLASPVLGIIFDLTALEFIDSSGIGMLVGYHRSARSAAKAIAIGAPRGDVDRLFRTTHLRNVLPIYDTIEAAATSIKPMIAQLHERKKTDALPLAEVAPIDPQPGAAHDPAANKSGTVHPPAAPGPTPTLPHPGTKPPVK